MAYGILYRLDWCNVNNVPLRVDILRNNYTGAISFIDGSASPFASKKINDEEGKKGVIITTEATLEILESPSFNINAITTADEKEFQVKFYINNVFEWAGFILPDAFKTTTDYGSVINLKAIDRIGALKDIPYLNTDGRTFSGKQNLLTVLTNCLKQTGIESNIKVLVDIISSDWDPVSPIEPQRALSFFRDTYISSERFSDVDGNVISCYDALKTTLNLCNARIYQNNGVVWIENKRQIEKGTGKVYTYDLSGLQVGVEIPFVQQNINFEQILTGGVQLSTPALSSVDVYSEHGRGYPPINNTDFNGYSSGSYPGWTNKNSYQIEDTFIDVLRYTSSGGISTQGVRSISRPWIKSGVVRSAFPFLQLKYKESPYMVSEAHDIDLSTASSLTLSVGIKGFNGDTFIAIVEMNVYNRNTQALIDTYFLSDGAWIKQTDDEYTPNYLSWVLPTPEGRTNTNPFAVQHVFEENVSEFIELNRVTDGQTKLSVRIYGHTRGGGTNYMGVIESLNIDVVYKNEPSGLLYSAQNKGVFSTSPISLTTLFSDKIDSGRNSSNFNSIARNITSLLYTRSGKLTELWTSLGSTDFLNMLVAEQVAGSFAKATKTMQVSVLADNLSLNSRFSFGCFDGSYILTDAVFNYSDRTVSGTFVEICNEPLNIVETIRSVNDSDKGSNVRGVGSISGGGGSGSAPQDLQSVTDIGAETTNIITARGVRAKELFSVPLIIPKVEDVVLGEKYLWIGDTGSGSPIPPIGVTKFIDLTDVRKPLTTGQFLQWNGTEVITAPLPIPVGIATESWVAANYSPIGHTHAVATTTANGFMSSADKAKLNGIAAGANNYVHPAKTWVDKTALSGASVISNLTIDSLGHPTNWTTRSLTPANIGAEPSFTKNTAFNKNFGTTAGTVSEGNHTHTFAQITSKPTTLAGYGITDGVTINTKQKITGEKQFITSLGVPLVAPSSPETGIKYLWIGATGSGGTPPPVGVTKFIDLTDVKKPLVNNGFLQWVSNEVITTTLPTPSDMATQTWVTANFEPKFTKNTAFNKNFGTASGTVAQGNDSRINNGHTAFDWGRGVSLDNTGSVLGTFTATGTEDIDNLRSIVGYYGGNILSMVRNSNYGGQFRNGTIGNIWEGRTKSLGVWSDWDTFWHSGNLPNPIQELTYGPVSGRLQLTGSEFATVTSLGRISITDFSSSSMYSGFHSYSASGATGFPTASGAGFRVQRQNLVSGGSGSFDIYHPTGGGNSIYFNTGGLSNDTWNGWETFASREWVNSYGLGSLAVSSEEYTVSSRFFRTTSSNIYGGFGAGINIAYGSGSSGSVRSAQFFIKDFNGGNITAYISGHFDNPGFVRELYHSGNLRSNAQNDSRYVLKAGDTMTGKLTAPSIQADQALSIPTAQPPSNMVVAGKKYIWIN